MIKQCHENFPRLRPLVLLLALVGLAAGCGDEALSDEPFGVLDLSPHWGDGPSTNPTERLPAVLPPLKAHSRGELVEVYDFGLVNRQTATSGSLVSPVNPIYFLFDDRGRPLAARPVQDERTGGWVMSGGNPTYTPNQTSDADRKQPHSIRPKRMVVDQDRGGSSAHQRPVIDITAADGSRYSGLWEVVVVTTEAGYIPDTIKSWGTLKGAIEANRFSARPTGLVINCPLVDDRTQVVPSLAAPAVRRPRMDIWHRTRLGSCLLVNGWETIGDPTGRLYRADEDEKRLATLDVLTYEVRSGQDVRRLISVPVGRYYQPMFEVDSPVPGQPKTPFRFATEIIVDERPRRAPEDPPGYSPVRAHWDVVVPQSPSYQPGRFKSAADVDDTLERLRTGGPWVRNLPTVGAFVGCGSTKNACENADACTPLGLECNPDTCLCDAMAVGHGEFTSMNFRRCRTWAASEDEKKFAPLGYLQHPRGTRGFCYPRCNAADGDNNPDAGLDSRCGDLPGVLCTTPTGDDKAQSLCLRTCKTTDPKEVQQSTCRSPLPLPLPGAPGASAQIVDVAARLDCRSERGVSACTYDDYLEPR